MIEIISFSNSNHETYVRKLTKRRARIKELEELYKKEAESSETYRVQLNDYREQLEQLENCQNNLSNRNEMQNYTLNTKINVFELKKKTIFVIKNVTLFLFCTQKIL